MKKILFTFAFLMLAIFVTGCTFNVPSFDEYNSELERHNMETTVATGEDLKDVLGDFAAELPDIALPKKIMVAGNFSEPIDIKGFLSGEKTYDLDKLSKEFKGIVIDCDNVVLATGLMQVKGQLLEQIKAQGLELDPSLQIVSKGPHVYIGYQDFLDCTYNYVPETQTQDPVPAN